MITANRLRANVGTHSPVQVNPTTITWARYQLEIQEITKANEAEKTVLAERISELEALVAKQSEANEAEKTVLAEQKKKR